MWDTYYKKEHLTWWGNKNKAATETHFFTAEQSQHDILTTRQLASWWRQGEKILQGWLTIQEAHTNMATAKRETTERQLIVPIKVAFAMSCSCIQPAHCTLPADSSGKS
jgi:hypothetical protein